MIVLLQVCNFLMHFVCNANLKLFFLFTKKHNQKTIYRSQVILNLYNIEGSCCIILFLNQWVKYDLIKEVL